MPHNKMILAIYPDPEDFHVATQFKARAVEQVIPFPSGLSAPACLSRLRALLLAFAQDTTITIVIDLAPPLGAEIEKGLRAFAERYPITVVATNTEGPARREPTKCARRLDELAFEFGAWIKGGGKIPRGGFGAEIPEGELVATLASLVWDKSGEDGRLRTRSNSNLPLGCAIATLLCVSLVGSLKADAPEPAPVRPPSSLD